MTCPRFIAAFIFLAACVCPCYAEGVIPAKLSVSDAVAIALGMNPGLKQAQEAELASQSRLRIADHRTSLNFGATTNFQNARDTSTSSAIE